MDDNTMASSLPRVNKRSTTEWILNLSEAETDVEPSELVAFIEKTIQPLDSNLIVSAISLGSLSRRAGSRVKSVKR